MVLRIAEKLRGRNSVSCEEEEKARRTGLVGPGDSTLTEQIYWHPESMNDARIGVDSR